MFQWFLQTIPWFYISFSVATFSSPLLKITLLKELMTFTVFPNSVLLCNLFQFDLLSLREIITIRSLVISMLPLDVSILILFNYLATLEKCFYFLLEGLFPSSSVVCLAPYPSRFCFVLFCFGWRVWRGIFLYLILK